MLDKVETDILSIADIEAAAGRTITFADAQKLNWNLDFKIHIQNKKIVTGKYTAQKGLVFNKP
jgi:hypothetical protein